jgi:hypothetical protein
MEDKRRELTKLQESKYSQLEAMGRNVPILVQTLKDQKRRFSSPPVGPLALFVKVKGWCSDFAPAIECALNDSLKSFVVANHKDLQVFREIRTKVGWFPHEGNVIVKEPEARFTQLDAPEDQSLLTVERAIHVTDARAYNVLVDVHAPESLLLVDNLEDAKRKLVDRSGQRLRFVEKAWLKDMSQYEISKSGRGQFTPAARFFPTHHPHPNPHPNPFPNPNPSPNPNLKVFWRVGSRQLRTNGAAATGTGRLRVAVASAASGKQTAERS